jgi:hypothetical protein
MGLSDDEEREQSAAWEATALAAVRSNHIWLNAFSCIRPTDEFCASLGRQILEMLDSEHTTIPSEHRLVGTERSLVIRINKS